MKKFFRIITILLLSISLVTILVGCSDNSIPNGIELSAKEGSISSESLVLIIKNNSDKYNYSFGNDFGLERYENDEWIAIPYINGGHSITTIRLGISPNTSQEFTTYFKNTWGELTEGNYRIAKHFDKKPLNDDSKVIAEEIHYYYFEIT